jgi:hypothetical protein
MSASDTFTSFVTLSKIFFESADTASAFSRYCSAVKPCCFSAFSYSARLPLNRLLMISFSAASTSFFDTDTPRSAAACLNSSSSTRYATYCVWTLWYSGVPALGNCCLLAS